MVSLESQATFEARAAKIGVPLPFIDELTAAGLSTFGAWAFCCTCDPNSSDDTPLKDAVEAMLERPITLQEMLFCRRLFFESRTYSVADMRARVERTGDDKPKSLSLAERLARIQKQQTDLVGVTWTAELEPAHKLVDQVVAMQEEGAVTFVPPPKCISRVQEIHHDKSEVALTFDSSGSIRMGKKQEEMFCDTNGELNLRNAWTRRNLAFDQAGLASFVVLEKWTTKLMLAKLREPPAGYRFVSTQQICDADKEFWLQLSQLSRGRLNPGTGPDKPLDDFIEKLSASPEVLCYMTPLPGSKRETDHSDVSSRRASLPTQEDLHSHRNPSNKPHSNKQRSRRPPSIGGSSQQGASAKAPMVSDA